MPSPLFEAIPVASGAPKSNRPGNVASSGPNRSSSTQTLIIAAGSKFQHQVAGQQFYVILATGKIRIKPNNGSENTYTQGTGEIVNPENMFRSLEISNPNSFNVVISIFVGFGGYIDNRAILYDPLVNQVSYSTFGVLGSANSCLIPDLSGSAFTDINGTQWLALTRLAIYITNYDLALTYNIKNTAQTRTVLGVIPQTSLVLNANGNFRVDDAANLQLIISEVYDAVLPGSF